MNYFRWCTYISRLLSQRRWFRFAACSTLLTMVTLVAFMEELSKTYEFHTRPYRSPPGKTLSLYLVPFYGVVAVCWLVTVL